MEWEQRHIKPGVVLALLKPAIEGIDNGCPFCIGDFVERANINLLSIGIRIELDDEYQMVIALAEEE